LGKDVLYPNFTVTLYDIIIYCDFILERQSVKQFLPVFKKEFRTYFTSPVFYIVAVVFLALTGYFFVNSVVNYSNLVIQLSGERRELGGLNPTSMIMKNMFNTMGTVFILLVPLMTMRLVAEEWRTRTMELLMTSPVSTVSIVLAKYLASVAVYSIIVLATAYMPFVIDYYSTAVWSQVIAGYLGVLLLGAAMLAAGLFCSTLTDKQIIAAVLTIGILVIFWFIGGVLGHSSEEVSRIMRGLSLFVHFDALTNGLLDMRDMAYLLSFSAVALFLSHRVLDAGRWKG
jgi:ABC-2 type transport system permease protein